MLSLIFFIACSVIVYVYIGYPLLTAVVGKICRRQVRKQPYEPSITILIAAYNEVQVLRATIENKLAQDYPAHKLEILVVSDGSSDGTDDIVVGFNTSRVRLLRQEPRAGKTSALNMAVPLAKGEILVISDANSSYSPDALRHLAANFADPEIGYVTGKMIYNAPHGTDVGDGCTTYMKYENILRSLETRLGSLVGVNGGIDAVRKELYVPMNPDQLPDFVLPLHIVEKGFRVVYEPRAILREQVLKQADDEYRMRVRVSLRTLWALFDMRRLLSFRANPLFAWQLWSHKVLRYLCFPFLLTAWLTNLLLWEKNLAYQTLFIIQNTGYLAALALPFLKTRGLNFPLFTLARYFVLLNLASAHAFGKFLLGKKQVMWIPRKG